MQLCTFCDGFQPSHNKVSGRYFQYQQLTLPQACRTPLARSHDDLPTDLDLIDAPNMQSYPSPNAGAADGGGPFYSSSGPQQPGIPSPDALQHLAQQSRNLAPIMSASLGGNMTDGQDPRGPSQGINQGNVNHQYGHDGLPSPQMQQSHGHMDPMGSQYGTPDGSMAPRKRSKVSRACDECRRKKVRCDATGESETEQCANCKRVGANCQFTRQPMKRGPSKGYGILFFHVKLTYDSCD